MNDLFSLFSSTGATDTAADSVYGSGVMQNLQRAVGTVANVMTAVQASKNNQGVATTGAAPVVSTTGTTSQGLPKWVIPAGIGALVLAVAAFFLLRK